MRKHLLMIIVIACFSVFALRSIFHPGFMYSHDSLWHVERLQNMFSLLPTQFPVRWSPSLDNGYGVPLFNFTYPAPYYLGAGFMALGLGPIKSYDLLLLMFYFLGGVGVYLLGRKKPLVGLFAALLYLFTPYQFLDIFVRGALGEVVALGLIPWVFLSFEQISKDGRLRWYSSIPFALLVLSHNFYGYLFGALLAFFILVIYEHKRELIFSLMLSLGLASFFLIPAFFEKNLLLFSQTDHLGYRDHFVYFSQLIYGKWLYLGSITGNNPYEMSYQLGVSNIIIFVVSAIIIVKLFIYKNLSKKLGWYLFALTLSIFMMLPVSDLIWSIIPLLPSIQFPWRFLGITMILFPLIYIESSKYFFKINKANIFKIISAFLVVLAIYASRNYGLPEYWMNADQFFKYHYEYVGKTTTAQRGEIVPMWAPDERYDSSLAPSIQAGEIKNFVDTPLSITFSASTSDQQNTVLERNYYPTWRGSMDGNPITLSPSSSGAINIPVEAGEHVYRIYYRSTQVQIIGNIISILTLVMIVATSIKYIPTNKHQDKSHW